MAGKDSEIQHIENDQIGRVDTADLSAAEKIDLQQAHTANTADLPALLADNISYGKSGVKGLVSSPYILGASFLASMGGFSFGYDQGVISIINVMPQFTAQYPQIGEDDPRSAFWKGLNTALLQLGCFMGCFFMPWLCDRISRKWAITVMVVFFNVGGIIMTAAPNYGTLAFGRWFSGLGTGTLALGAPLYISEIAPPNLRGTLLVLESISIVSGVVISFFITYGTRHMEGDISFRLPFGLQLVSSTILGLLIHIFPYSPRWLCLKGRNDEALAALCKLRRLPDTDERIQIEHAGIMAEVELQYAMQERAHPGKSGFRLELAQWGDLFRKKMWRRTVVGVGVAFFQQFSGINAFIYYAPTLFQSLGSDYEMSLILSGVMNVIQLVAVLLCFLIIDTLGRRPLAIYGAATACVCYIIIAGLVGSYSDDWSANTAAGWVCVAMAFAFMFFYGLSYSPLGWALPSEVYSTTTRAKGVALATATVWLCNFIVGLATPPMIEGAGFGTYIFFGGFCGLACVWAYLFVPETKGKTLEQMDEVFGDKSAQEEKELMKEAMRRGSKTGIAVAPGVMGGVPGEHDAKDFA